MLQKQVNRIRRKKRVRSQIVGTSVKPRLSVFRSTSHIYAQVVDDISWKTLLSASDIKMAKWTKIEKAASVWSEIAKKATWLKITTLVFDRWGFAYHGRVKALAEAARQWGLQF